MAGDLSALDTTADENGEPRSRKGKVTRARLVDAAKIVFERDGFLKARIADISDTAGMSHGSFYHYFDSKEQIFREVAREQEISLIPVVHDPDHHRDPIEKIRDSNRAYLESYQRAAAIMRVIEEVTRYDEVVRNLRARRKDEVAERIRISIERLQDQGLADLELDPRYAAYALAGMISRFAESWLVQGGDFDMDTSVEQLTRLWTSALGMRTDGDGAVSSVESRSAQSN
jgi:AcrR family transcriptional regulator